MSAEIYQLCRVYEDTLLAVLETFGERPFTAADLREWVRALGGKDRFSRAMKVRCGLVAAKGSVSEQVAKAAIIKKMPELEAYL
jgi:hypothetical protein